MHCLRGGSTHTSGPANLFGCLLSFSNHVGGLKQRGVTTQKELQRKQRVTKPEAPSEELLMAMALSRSEMEQEARPVALRLGGAFSERIRLGAGRHGPAGGGLSTLLLAEGDCGWASGCVDSSVLDPVLRFCLPPEKKSRKRKAPVSPPLLLVQDPETTGRQTEDRVAQLFAEEMELACTPPLPASRILKEELGKAGWCLQPSGRKQNFLWEGSALTGAWALEAFYTASLVPPMVPQRPTKVCLPSGHTGGSGERPAAPGRQHWASTESPERKEG